MIVVFIYRFITALIFCIASVCAATLTMELFKQEKDLFFIAFAAFATILLFTQAIVLHEAINRKIEK